MMAERSLAEDVVKSAAYSSTCWFGRKGDSEMSASRGMWQSAVILLLLIEPSKAWAQKRQIPAPQRDLTIFFDWNSAVISSRNKDVIAQAALNAKNLMDLRGRVEVRGYVDTSYRSGKRHAIGGNG